MSDHDNEHIQEHIKVYLTVFGALGVLTLLTVAVSYLNVSTIETIFLALTIATVKASLVAGYFMHLITEKQTIIWLLTLTFIFFLFCMFIPMITYIEHTSLSWSLLNNFTYFSLLSLFWSLDTMVCMKWPILPTLVLFPTYWLEFRFWWFLVSSDIAFQWLKNLNKSHPRKSSNAKEQTPGAQRQLEQKKIKK